MFAAPAADASAGYTTVVQWEGGKTKACRVDDPATGTSRVKVFWDGKAYADDGPYKIVNHESKAAGKPLALTPKHW